MSTTDTLKSLHGFLVEKCTGKRVVFHHIPKCGGTSVARALRRRYIVSQATVHPISSFNAVRDFYTAHSNDELMAQVRRLRQQILLYLLYQDVRCLACHVPFCEAAYSTFNDKYKFVTILRDPVARFLSHYYHSYQRDDYSKITMSLEEYVYGDEARALGAIYAAYLSGSNSLTDFTGESAVFSACQNLEKLDCVGFLDDISSFENTLCRQLGVRVRVGHENRARQGSRKHTAVRPELREKIAELCAPDIRIYSHARQIWADGAQ